MLYNLAIDRSKWLTHGILTLVGAAGIGIGALFPDHFYALMQEDGWTEWATFLAFLAGGLLGIRYALRADRGLDKIVGFGLAAFMLFVAGEEISWGHRLFAFEPPDVFLENNYQQEMNVHNLLKSVLDTRWMVTIIAVSYGALLPLIVRVGPLRRFRKLAPGLGLMPWFLLVAGLEVFYPFPLTGELAELLLGLVLLGDLGFRSTAGGEIPPLAAPIAQAVSLGLAVLLMPLLEAVIYGDQPANVERVRAELETISQDLSRDGVLRHKLWRKRRVHKRLFTAVKSRYIRFEDKSRFLDGRRSPAEARDGEGRSDRKGYFLDVWNQPYWVLYQRKRGERRLTLYSFGPNRRRDWDTHQKGPATETGDDILVSVEVAGE